MEEIRRAEVVRVTPDMATELLGTMRFNRPLSKECLNFYASQMSRGEWKFNGTTICVDVDGNVIDGQHRLHSIIKSGVPIETVIVYGCERESFTTLDTGRGRNFAQVLAIQGVKDYSNVAASVNKYLLLKNNYSAVSDPLRGSCSFNLKIDVKLSNADKLRVFNETPDTFIELSSFGRRLTDQLNILTKSDVSGICAYLILGLGIDMGYVYGFFEELFKRKLETNYTLFRLREILLVEKYKEGAKLTALYRQMLIAKTWNAYVDGVVLDKLQWSEKKEKKVRFKNPD